MNNLRKITFKSKIKMSERESDKVVTEAIESSGFRVDFNLVKTVLDGNIHVLQVHQGHLNHPKRFLQAL